MNSMTGFGAASVPFGSVSLRVEVSGINRKQPEYVINLPRSWAELESQVRDFVSRRISRGRVCVVATLGSVSGNSGGNICINHERLASLCENLKIISSACHRPVELGLDALLRIGVLSESAEDIMPLPRVWSEALSPALTDAMDAFMQMRSREGETLCRDLLSRVAELYRMRDDILRLAADVPLRYRKLLFKRLTEQGLSPEEPDERLVKELALYADKCDMSEELTRLLSHLQQFEAMCRQPQAVGRSLDFLCQEIFRELNTAASKANSAPLAQIIVSAKTELEKIREQVQNVE